MKTYDLFPTLVGTEIYSKHDEFKRIFFSNLPKYLREDGITGEESGHVDLHLNSDFEDFFKFVSNTAEEYIQELIGSKDIWELWLVKTWFSDFSVPSHNHEDAHLSFVYYVNVPIDVASPLHMIPPGNRANDLVSGMFLDSKTDEVLKEYNQYNCKSVRFEPKEGGLIVFPSKINHVVEDVRKKDRIEDRRISIAGDFILTYKKQNCRSMGLQPIQNWRSMNRK